MASRVAARSLVHLFSHVGDDPLARLARQEVEDPRPVLLVDGDEDLAVCGVDGGQSRFRILKNLGGGSFDPHARACGLPRKQPKEPPR